MLDGFSDHAFVWIQALRLWNPGQDVVEFKGGMALPASFQVLVSTPDAFKAAQLGSSLLNWSLFGVIVFDEVCTFAGAPLRNPPDNPGL